MKSLNESLKKLNTWIGRDGKVAFIATLILGLLTHLQILVSDIPNHDGLGSIYFDQNMITSGRWFLGAAAGISSFYSIPTLIGILSIVYLSVTAIFVCKLLKIEEPVLIVIVSGILVAFPSIASDFAYVFTMDGYMLGLLLSVLAVYFVEKGKPGFVYGGICLAFSMGIYQAYLPVTMLLSLYLCLMILAGNEGLKERIKKVCGYVCMGVIGVALYYVILKIMLLIQGKSLGSYQGMDTVSAANTGLIGTIKKIYVDFVSFTLKGHVLSTNVFTLMAAIALLVAFLAAVIYFAIKRSLIKNIWFYIISLLTVIAVPVFANVILIISPDVTYHLLMRYQWAFFIVIAIAFIGNVLKESELKTLAYITVIAGIVLVFGFAVADNIGYANLNKKYEKTYAYCLRLADRIEQTEGYYTGIPIYMIGVVGTDNYPVTDITENVTDHMIGLGGDYLLYTADNYELFFRHYMGITFNFLKPDEANFYDSKEYVEMPSFPGKGSTKVVDGVLFVKTENMH